jgi:hypothetical protein
MGGIDGAGERDRTSDLLMMNKLVSCFNFQVIIAIR